MGVFSIFKRFVLITFELLFAFIIFVNLMSFSGINFFNGGAFDMYGTNGNNFTNSYFGFSSLLNSIADLDVGTLYIDFTTAFNELFQSISVGVSAMERVVNSQGVDILLNAILFIIDILIAPIRTLLYFLRFLVFLFAYLYVILSWFTRLIGGYYNIPLRTM